MIDQLIISNPDRTKKFVSGFIFEPNESRKENGQLAFLLEIEYQLTPLAEDIVWAKEFVNKLINYLNINYYQSSANFSDINKKFENLIQELNQWLNEEFSKQFSLSLVILVIKDNNLYFTAFGNILAYLYQQNKFISLLEPNTEYNQSLKFSNIISGTLELNDQVIFWTNNLFNYYPQQKLESILKYDAKIVLKKIHEQIKELEDRISLGLILIQYQLNRPEKVAPKIKTLITQTKISVSQKFEELPKELMVAEKPVKLEKPQSKRIFSFSFLCQRIGILIKKIILFIIRKFKIDILIKNLKFKFDQLSYLQKILGILLLIVIIIFIQSLIIFTRQEYNKQLSQKYENLIKMIQDKQNEFNAALIYKNEAKAKLLLKEIDLLLNKLPRQSIEQKQMYDYLSETFRNQMGQLYHQQYIIEPNILVDLLEIDNKIKVGGIAKLGNKIYFFNPNNNFIYQINLENYKVDLINQTSVNIGYLKKVISLDKDNLLFFHSNQGLAAYNIVNKNFSPLELVSQHQNLEIKDFIIYLGRLYILDSKNNQVYKYTKTAGGFGKEEPYLKEQINLSQSISLSADGSIYILFNDGRVLKFYRGVKQDFKLAEIYPLLTQPTKILTWLESKYIYILEPINKRLVIFDKNGQLIKQIVSDYFDNLTDFVVNEKENTAWLLNGTKIIEIPLK
jgi:hypothetical protein